MQRDFEGDDEIPYMQVGAFALFTQRAKGAGDWGAYARCVSIIDRLLANAAPDLNNALHVSYLEHIDFEGPRGAKAWSLLTPRVQAAWNAITEYNRSLEERTRKGERDS